MPDKFYITTTLPYVNSDPHLGFALELVQADAIARYHQSVLKQGVFFNTGTDEHGQKVYVKGKDSGKSIQDYVDEYAAKFRELVPALGISPEIHFIRTTDPHHVQAAQEFWRLCDKAGDIYKKNYQVKYCVGCELEKTESDLDQSGHCLIHPHLEIELIDEENYFFRFSKYQQPLLDFYEQHPNFVVPDFRFNEIKQFVKTGLQDFSISRLAKKMPWGVPVPKDSEHVMYVWFDALINYISTLGWPSFAKTSEGKPDGFVEFWGTKGHENCVQIAGKDNLRQQSAMWQAMLMSAGLPNSQQIIIHGFINSGGQKMSKSLGNVADPYQILDRLKQNGLTQEQATDAVRHYLLREIPTFEDGDYTWEKFVESYNAGLANGIGNLTSRILKMAVNAGIQNEELRARDKMEVYKDELDVFSKLFDKYQIQKACDWVWNDVVKKADAYIQSTEPFKTIKSDPKKGKTDILHLLDELYLIAVALEPILPRTSGKILSALTDLKSESVPRLFPRIE
ncbi:MAG: methionine--tRNA ligase [Patescibacteria group bacterium]|nr:methionine--tRNA ligase [Patescibacteria group bacterium]